MRTWKPVIAVNVLADRLRKVRLGRVVMADESAIRLFDRSRCCSCMCARSFTDNDDMRFFEARTV